MNKLETEERTIEMTPIIWGCECPDWIQTKDYKDNPDSIGLLCVYIEPMDSNMALPDTIGYTGDIVRFTGHFYINQGLPNGYEKIEEPAEIGRIFQYSKYEIIKSNYNEYRTDSTKQ